MADYLIQDTTLTAIAESIRSKTGGTENIPPEEMPAGVGEVYEAGRKAEQDTLVELITRTITEFEVPEEVTVIGASAFNGCSKLKTIKMHDGVTSIKSYAFNACQILKLSEIPAGITEIQTNAFVLCRSITSLTFKGTPTTINATAFNSCDNLVTINVPWEEGEVANAPWGATNATINYNYTGG